ncbi:peroxiredoxin-6-like [Pongo abelii]|uniref:peroxiredoxin-6-like n=1 Tax=Pongo abelii TaxID=9601 RepID=UPI0023E806C7|nr:peroxiredoxin-6-like [Pongo abelii]
MPGGRLLGDVAPNFEANTTTGRICFQDFLGNSLGILFSHPRDFTPVCSTELGRAAKLAPEFAKRNVRLIIALSIDHVEDHLAWSKDINAYNGEEPTEKLPFPIIDDKNWDLFILLGMLDPAEKDEKDMPVTARVVFVIGPDKKLKLYIIYPATTGRNFDDILRVATSLQLTAEKRVATPVDWKDGDSVMVLPMIPEEEAKKLFLKGVFTKELPSGKKYLCSTPQP